MLNQSNSLDRMFHALADASRRRVVRQLSRAPATVSEVAKPLRMSLPSVLQHLKVLEESGLIRTEKTGRIRTCHIEPRVLSRAETWIASQRAVLQLRLDRLGDFLSDTDDDLPEPA